jgi:hypothetical protein
MMFREKLLFVILIVTVTIFVTAVRYNPEFSQPADQNQAESDTRWIPRFGEEHAVKHKWECGQWDGEMFHRIECPGGERQ